MKILALLWLSLELLFATGCAVTMGANVKKFNLRGQSFVKCTVIVQEGDHKLAEESLEVCKDAFGQVHRRDGQK